MKKHVMAMTYEPKIDAVLSGDCRQTIRKGNKFSIGDEILIHGWEDKPYRSKWSWRMHAKVVDVLNILVSNYGILYHGTAFTWKSKYCDCLAKQDGLVGDGEQLRKVLFEFNGKPTVPDDYQIIRW